MLHPGATRPPRTSTSPPVGQTTVVQSAPFSADTPGMASDLHSPERPEARTSDSAGRLASFLAGAAGVGLVLLGALFGLASSIWGPGSHDAIVLGGVTLVPWFGLPLVVVGAGGFVVRRASQRRIAWGGLSLAVLAAVSWWVILIASTDSAWSDIASA